MTGVSPLDSSKGHGYFIPQIWKRENRTAFLGSQNEKTR